MHKPWPVVDGFRGDVQSVSDGRYECGIKPGEWCALNGEAVVFAAGWCETQTVNGVANVAGPFTVYPSQGGDVGMSFGTENLAGFESFNVPA